MSARRWVLLLLLLATGLGVLVLVVPRDRSGAPAEREALSLPPGPPPASAELGLLVRDTLLDFNEAVRSGDFTAFHGKVSRVWREQTTPEGFREIYRSFVDQGIDLSAVRFVEPVLEPLPPTAERGLLVVAGHYPTAPSRVRFRMTFLFEPPSWRLVALEVDVG